jgi:CheY-like chemotaxis protein
MLGTWLSLVFSIVLLIALYALGDRLQLLTNKTARGRLAFFAGTFLLLLGSLWTALRFRPGYQDWFVEGAYSIIDVVQLIVIIGGLVFVVYGLSRFFESLIDLQAEVEYREQKLNILENLQHDAREPYQFLELLNLAIKEIASTIPECAAAVFLVGRNRKQFILATSIGLKAEETNCLEYYPFGDNDISQAVEMGEAVLSGKFVLLGENGEEIESRFQANLILPLISGMDKIGAIILLSTVERIFSQGDIKTLAPVGEWLAEKIKSARVTKEVSVLRKDKEEITSLFNDNSGRIENAANAFNTPDIFNNLCMSIKGFAESEAVHLAAIINGSVEFLGGSEPAESLSEQYAEALADTIEKGKTAVINQNSQDEKGRSYTSLSTIVYPLSGTRAGHALVLKRQQSPFALDNFHLKILGIFGKLTQLALNKSEAEKLELIRRLGFDKIVQLLRLPQRLSFEEDPGFFARHLASLLPQDASVLSFVHEDDMLKLADVFGESMPPNDSIRISLHEGSVGRAAADRTAVILKGKREIEKAFEEFESENEAALKSLFVNLRSPAFAIVSPLTSADKVAGVVGVFFGVLSESERREWERLIMLACGLFSMRMNLAAINQRRFEELPEENFYQVVNAINNNLAAVMGNAEILMTRGGLDNEVRAQLQSILNEADIASSQLKGLTDRKNKHTEIAAGIPAADLGLNEAAGQILKRSHVSENLYMIAGRAREIEFKAGELGSLEFSGPQMQEFFSAAINKFAALAAEDDVITITTYKRGSSAYLDISRHRRNFPPVESVAGFGNYQIPDEVLKARPSDKYLEKLAGSNCRFAYDRFSPSPSYLSFKFPLKKESTSGRKADGSAVQILAVDDQPVILELISAMCQTLGFSVTTALSGPEALSLSKENEFDVILTDLAMPGMSGLELSKLLRLEHPETPIILITGWEATIDRDELEKSGITDILYKPFRIEQLTSLVKAAATGQSA